MTTGSGILSAAALALSVFVAGPAAAAEQRAAPRAAPGAPQAPAAGRGLPPGAGEAEVRRHCTQKYDEAARLISDAAGGSGGMLIDQLLIEFQDCLRRHGARR